MNTQVWDSKYGPNLRAGNQDLDPYLQFLSWFPQVGDGGGILGGQYKHVQVKVARNAQDLDHAICLSLPINCLSKRHLNDLSILGFTIEQADKKYELMERAPSKYISLHLATLRTGKKRSQEPIEAPQEQPKKSRKQLLAERLAYDKRILNMVETMCGVARNPDVS